MHTVRCSGRLGRVSAGRGVFLSREGVCPGGCLPGGCLPWEGVYPGGLTDTTYWTEWLTDIKVLPCATRNWGFASFLTSGKLRYYGFRLQRRKFEQNVTKNIAQRDLVGRDGGWMIASTIISSLSSSVFLVYLSGCSPCFPNTRQVHLVAVYNIQ